MSSSEPYFKWCSVTNRVLEDKEKPRYIFWAPSEDEDDSGWRIRAGDENEEYLNDPSNSQRVPLGEVVYHDDSFKHLLFLEKETAYLFDEGQLWVEVDNDQP